MTLLALLFMASFGNAPVQPPDPVPDTDPGNELRIACWKGDLAEATRLVNAGAPIEGGDRFLRTPLFLACHGSPEIVKLLLDHGARADVVAKNGDTTIGRACEYGDLESAKMVLAAGADMNRENNYGHTPLMLAAREGHDALVAWLIAQHVDVNHEGKSIPAIYYATWKDHSTIVKLLLDAGATATRTPATIANNPHQEPLIAEAAHANDLPLVDLLIDHHADVNEANDTGRSVLMYAVQADAPATITHLLEKGANPNAQNNEGQTALMLAINFAPISVLQDLLGHGARLETQDKKGRTALIWASRLALGDQVHFFVEHGADINATDHAGETALTFAGDRGAVDVVDYLKGKGAKRTDVHIIDKGPSVPPITAAQRWALAVGAVYTQHNGENPQILGYTTDLADSDDAKQEMKSDWGVTNRAQLLAQVELLRATGDRAQIQKLGAAMAVITDEDFANLLQQNASDPKRQASLRAVRASFLKWKNKSGVAWDLCRSTHLICNGYSAGFITADEAWPLLLKNAWQVQTSFNSWHEMSDNFLDGREIGYGFRDPQFDAAVSLLNDAHEPNSPWNQLPWNTDLLGP